MSDAMLRLRLLLSGLLLLGSAWSHAETGAEGWLRYAPIGNARVIEQYRTMPGSVFSLNDSQIVRSAESELVRGISGMLGRKLEIETALPDESAFVLGTITELQAKFPHWSPAVQLRPEGYAITSIHEYGHTYWLIAGADARGVLYGTFRLLEMIGEQKDLSSLSVSESPSAPVRWVNQWDNLNGTIERGYAGRSIFFDNGGVRVDLTRAAEYARLLASVGINGIA